jgi:hypothetical protein
MYHKLVDCCIGKMTVQLSHGFYRLQRAMNDSHIRWTAAVTLTPTGSQLVDSSGELCQLAGVHAEQEQNPLLKICKQTKQEQSVALNSKIYV